MKNFLKCKNRLLCFCAVAVVFFDCQAATASDVDYPDYCIPLYARATRVTLGYIADIPYTGMDWDKILKQAKRSSEAVLREGGLAFDTVQNPDMSSDTVNVKLVYSFIDKKASTIELEGSRLVSWIEVSRKIKGEDGKFEVVIDKSKPKFLEAPLVDGRDLHVFLSSAPMRELENVACSVISYSSNKKCINRNDRSKFKIVPREKSCVDLKNKPYDPVMEAYKKLMEKKNSR